MSVSLLSQSQLPSIKKKAADKRPQNKKVEHRRLEWLVQSFLSKIESNDVEFYRLMASVGVPVDEVESVICAGSSSQKYDLVIVLKSERERERERKRSITIEHKGILSRNKHNIDTEHPWCATPELLNITYSGSIITQLYCYVWYTCYIPQIANHFGFSDIPLLWDWMRDDASQGSPKTMYGIELKKKAHVLANNAFIRKLYYHSLTRFWKAVLSNQQLVSSIEAEILTKMNLALDRKDIWMNAVYNTPNCMEPSDMVLSIPPRVTALKLVRPTWGKGKTRFDENEAKKCTVVINYKLTSNVDKLFEGRLDLNFGNRNGIANVRLLVRGCK